MTLRQAYELDETVVWVDGEGRDWQDDPHAGERGYYVVPVIDLVAAAEGYDPEGILVWVPALEAFGTWDPDHWDLIVFTGSTWDDIAAEPAPFLNAQWGEGRGDYGHGSTATTGGWARRSDGRPLRSRARALGSTVGRMGRDDEVLVVGGGLAGLSAAVGLRQRGLAVRVFEAAPTLREAGAGLNLWVNGVAALERLGLIDAVMAASSTVEVQETRSRRGVRLSSIAVGELARTYSLPPPVVLRRTELLRTLAAPLPTGVVELDARGLRFTQDDDGVILHLDGGREFRGSALVGADGINSPVRRQLHPDVRPRYAGYQSLRGLTRLPSPLAPEGTFTMTHGGGDRFGFSPAGGEWLWWYAVIPVPEGASDGPGGRKRELLRRFGRFAAPVPEIIEATPDDAILRNDVRDIAPMSRWGEGRVTLIGDAAHAATVGGGRGASEAIEDGVALARSLAGAAAVPAALRSFEAARMRPTAAVQDRSWRYGVVASRSHPLACAARSVTSATTGRRRAVRGMHAEFAALRDAQR